MSKENLGQNASLTAAAALLVDYVMTVAVSPRTAPAVRCPGGEGDPQLRAGAQGGRDALARLVSSISRFRTPEQAAAAAHIAEVEILDSRRMGGARTLDAMGRP